MHKLRDGLPVPLARIAKLPIDERGYPVPFFVQWIDGKPDFRVIDPAKMVACVKMKLCWVCGEGLGAFKTFPIGPMCSVNRISSEPPSHLDCAQYSVRACPFLSRPAMVRREDELTDACAENTAGVAILTNPGVTALWTTKYYKVFNDGTGKPLFSIGEPEHVEWWREGRPASRLEVLDAIKNGLPNLVKTCADREEELLLASKAQDALKHLPA